MNAEEQYRRVYDGIAAVAAHCDGAITDDGVGFNGQDTKFGRRIAGVPYEYWTEDIKVEAARIALTYKVQIMTYTGFDVGSLEVVRSASGLSTNRVARSEALGFERRAQNAGQTVHRKIGSVDGNLWIAWAKRDPDFEALRDAVRSMPKREWTGTYWTVPNFEGIRDFIEAWDFDVHPNAWAIIDKPIPVHYDITLQEGGQRVVIKTNLTAPGQPAADAVRSLPGRAFDRVTYANTADASPFVVAFAARFGLRISPEAVVVCEKAAGAYRAAAQSELDANDRRALNVHISRLRRPEDLPDVVEEILKGILS